MARLIAVCDQFCNWVITPPDQEKMTPAAAIERLFVLYGEILDVVYLVELAKIFKVNPRKWLENLKNVDPSLLKR